LVGLGGVGKTQLALSYAYETRETAPGIWVLWLHCSSATRLADSVHEVVQRLRIPGHDDKAANMWHLLARWLGDAHNGPWVLVLDNVDDAGIILQPLEASNSTVRARKWLELVPFCDHGKVIITSRSMSEACQVVRENQIIEVSPMNTELAEELLQQKLRGLSRMTRLRELAQALDCMPLALSQAASYIRQRSSTYSIERYLNELSDQKKRNDLLKWDPKFHDRDEDASNSILLTWQISFEHLRDTSSSAARLLSVMSLCDRQAIPRILFCDTHEDWDDDTFRAELGETIVFHDTFEDDVVALENFAFISPTGSGQTWQMHRLVQDATRLWLAGRNQLEENKACLASCLARSGPTRVKFENWPRCQMLYPHVISALDLKPNSKDALLDWAQAMYIAGWYAWAHDRFEDEQSLAEASCGVRMAELGLMDVRTLRSKNLFASVLVDREFYVEAEWLCKEALTASRSLLGDDDCTTIDLLSSLGSCYAYQGKYQDAEILQTRILSSVKQQWGDQNFRTSDAMIRLARTFSCLRKFRDAEIMQEDVLRLVREIHGENNPRTFGAMSCLAKTYADLGKYQESVDLLREAIMLEKNVLGDQHSYVLSSMYYLAIALRGLGRYTEAEDILKIDIKKRTKLLGQEHLSTLASMKELASILRDQNRFQETEEVERKALSISIRVRGEEHPFTLESMANLGFTLVSQHHYQEAKEIQRKALSIQIRVLGEEHPDTLTSMYNFADTLWKLDQLDEAERLMSQAVEGRTKVLGEEHPNTLTSMSNLGSILHSQQRFREAEEIDRKILSIRIRVLAEEHASTLISMHNLADTLWKLDQLDEAERLMSQAVEGRTKVLGTGHPYTIGSVNALQAIRKEIQKQAGIAQWIRTIFRPKEPHKITTAPDLEAASEGEDEANVQRSRRRDIWVRNLARGFAHRHSEK